MGLSHSRTRDPEGIYVHATAPAILPISVAAAEGPEFILVILCCVLCGSNTALYFVYMHLFGGRRGDPAILQIAVLVSVLCCASQAVYGSTLYYYCDLIALYSPIGFDVNRIDAYVVPFHTLQAVPEAIGQVYFALRIAKLFDHRRLSTRICLAFTFSLVAVQFILINWFGAAFYSVGYKSRLLDEEKRGWVKGIISAWTVVFIALEVAMTSTTLARLMVLRRKTTMDGARRVIFNLAVYSVQGQVLLTGYSMSSLYLFSRSATGWYTPLYLLSGSLYTLILLANLIYRAAVASAMKEAQSSSQERDPSHPSHPSQRERPLNAVCTYTTEPREHVQLETVLPPPKQPAPDWWHKERRDRATQDDDAGSNADSASMRSWHMEPNTVPDSGDAKNYVHRLPLSRRPSDANNPTPTLPLVRINTKTSFRSFKQYHF